MTKLTVRAALELLGHEAIVPMAYKDSVGVWTWGVGITNASGHNVMRYKDKPQSIQRVLEVYFWALKSYMENVLEAFEGYELSETQFAGALSFEYNTGSILEATWVDAWKRGDIEDARRRFMLWNKPKQIIGRRKKECALFFDGKWSQRKDGTANVYHELNAKYRPMTKSIKRVFVRDQIEKLLSPFKPKPPHKKVLEDLAAKDRVSTVDTATKVGGGFTVLTGIATQFREFLGQLAGIEIPRELLWFILAAVVLFVLWWIWKERKAYRQEAVYGLESLQAAEDFHGF